MIPLDEARAFVLTSCPPLAPEDLFVGDAIGTVLAADVSATVAVPPFANSAMDGYALRAADLGEVPATLSVVATILAGSASSVTVGPGQAARIMTGAPLPPGADAVCMVERTRAFVSDSGGDGVVVEEAVVPGESVRPSGDDIASGEVVLEAGTVIGPAQLAALVSAGCSEVAVYPRPRIGVMSTGDELAQIGRPLGPGQIYDSNRPMLLAMVDEAGALARDLGHRRDDQELISSTLSSAVGECDAVVLSGGVSVGDVDLVKVVLEKLGEGSGRWMQIAIRPARPFAFARIGDVPVFGLPGNPVSAAVGFELLVRPALRAMAGHRALDRPRLRARARSAMRRRPDGKIHFVRVQVAGAPDGSWDATAVSGQGSHQITSLARSSGLAVLPDGTGVPEGELVDVIVTDTSVFGPR